MLCKNCGNELAEGSQFCNKCGTKCNILLNEQTSLTEINEVIPSSQKIENLLSLFQSLLKSDNIVKQYTPKLKHFFSFVRETMPVVEKDVYFLRKTFEREITADFLEKSVIDFIRINKNANSEQIFENYFTSVISFFKIMNLNHIIINPEILRIYSVAQDDYSSLYQIKQRAKTKLLNIFGINLKKREPDPPLEEEEMLFLIEYCDEKVSDIVKGNENRKTNKLPVHFLKFSNCVFSKFILFTGIKYDKLTSLSYESFNREYRTFTPQILNIQEPEKNYEIHLPKNLCNQIFQYLDYRDEILKIHNKIDNKYFLIDKNGDRLPNGDKQNITRLLIEIKDSYISEKIGELKNEYLQEQNHFTVTGLTKYSIIEMIKKGVNQSIIQDFTGNEKSIYDSCQEYVNHLYEDNRTRYLDSKLRGIPLFDML